jgi:hypothetical protein
MLLFFIRVTRTAVDRSELGGVGKFLLALQIAVTIGALQGGVGRGPQSSLVEGRWDSRLALAGAAAGFVAIQARPAAWQRLGLLGVDGQSKEESNSTHGAESDQKMPSPAQSHTICPRICTLAVEFRSKPSQQQFGYQRNSGCRRKAPFRRILALCDPKDSSICVTCHGAHDVVEAVTCGAM